VKAPPARRLGHSSPTITLDHYAHVMPEAGGKGATPSTRCPIGPLAVAQSQSRRLKMTYKLTHTTTIRATA
jgi:hypothetical protein